MKIQRHLVRIMQLLAQEMKEKKMIWLRLLKTAYPKVFSPL